MSECLLHPSKTDSHGPLGMEENGCAGWLVQIIRGPRLRSVQWPREQEVPKRNQSAASKPQEKAPKQLAAKGKPVEAAALVGL